MRLCQFPIITLESLFIVRHYCSQVKAQVFRTIEISSKEEHFLLIVDCDEKQEQFIDSIARKELGI
jgi:hypothetical protein